MFTASILVVLLRLNLSKIFPAPRAFSADSWNSRQYPDLVLVLLALSLLLAVHYSGDASIKATLEVAFFVSHGVAVISVPTFPTHHHVDACGLTRHLFPLNWGFFTVLKFSEEGLAG